MDDKINDVVDDSAQGAAFDPASVKSKADYNALTEAQKAAWKEWRITIAEPQIKKKD